MNEQRMNDAKYVFYLGISLTAFTSSGAFVLMMMNPKDASYSVLPLIYAAVCFATGILAHVLAKRAETMGTVSDPTDAGRSS
jgi:hypothetical protein